MPSSVDFKIHGAKVLAARLKGLGVAWPKAVEKALFQETKALEAVAIDRTPREFGPLRASYETATKRERNKITATIFVGGPSAPYAAAVHERVEVFHEIGGPLFLKSTLDEVRHNFGATIGDRIRSNHALR